MTEKNNEWRGKLWKLCDCLLLFTGSIPRGVLPWIWQNPETYRAKCHHRRWFGMHFDQVTANGVNSNKRNWQTLVSKKVRLFGSQILTIWRRIMILWLWMRHFVYAVRKTGQQVRSLLPSLIRARNWIRFPWACRIRHEPHICPCYWQNKILKFASFLAFLSSNK